MKYFLAPRSGEKSYKNFQSTIRTGVPYGRIYPFLTDTGRDILSKQEVIYAWGNREGKSSEWKKMEVGDTIIFYANYNLVLAGNLIYKLQSKELALAMWPPDDDGNPWEYTFYINNLRYFKIPMAYFRNISGYNMKFVQGFQEITPPHTQQILSHYKSFNDLFNEFKDEGSVEMPKIDEPIHVNITRKVEPEFIIDFRLKPYEKKTSVATSKTRQTHPVNFEEKHKRNSKTGSIGEELAMQDEKKYLTSIGRKDLADKIMRVSLEDMAAGYDILSFDKEGKEKLIEVKSTVMPLTKDFSFIISSNEKKVADLSDNYYIYLIFSVDTEHPKIVSLKNPFTHNFLSIEPSQYIVKGTSLKIEKDN